MGNCICPEDRRRDDRLKQYRYAPNRGAPHPSQGTGIPNFPQSNYAEPATKFRPNFDLNELWSNLFLEKNIDARTKYLSKPQNKLIFDNLGKQVIPLSLYGKCPTGGLTSEVLLGPNRFQNQGQSRGCGDPEQQLENAVNLIDHNLLSDISNHKEIRFSDTPLIIGIHKVEVRVVGQGKLLSVPVWNVLSEHVSLLSSPSRPGKPDLGNFYLRALERRPELNNAPVEIVRVVSYAVVEDTKKVTEGVNGVRRTWGQAYQERTYIFKSVKAENLQLLSKTKRVLDGVTRKLEEIELEIDGVHGGVSGSGGVNSGGDKQNKIWKDELTSASVALDSLDVEGEEREMRRGLLRRVSELGRQLSP